ncbi:hypothetical protein [Streptomyces sp. S1D4-20]|uniref:hypothetical protein n=1 Tax=Streptomyces sp. S1D4-20 TaxID=2594462 RepID=UPI001164AE2B|nr:hypothetical protein [Streptomyces sp. S1D4-20]QDN57364.1 hypothetical protein FNV67_20270 [Streptomyces sp. S1D4-20]
MPDTFGGEWNRPRDSKHHDRQRGHSQRELQDRAGFDNEAQTGCGALLMLCVLVVAAVLGLALS